MKASNNSERTNVLSFIGQRMREVTFLAGLACASFMVLSLYSYNPVDSAWLIAEIHPTVTNLGGYVGAVTSEFLLWLFGLASLFLPALLAYTSFLTLYKHSPLVIWQMWWGCFIGLRVLGGMILILSVCGLLTMHGSPELLKHWLPAGVGGVLGTIISDSLQNYLGVGGASLFLTTNWLIGLTLLAQVDWAWGFLTLTELVKLAITTSAKLSFLLVQKIIKLLFYAVKSTTHSSQQLLLQIYHIQNPKLLSLPNYSEPNETSVSAPETIDLIFTPTSTTKFKTQLQSQSVKPKIQPVVKIKPQEQSIGRLPSIQLLEEASAQQASDGSINAAQLRDLATLVEQHLSDFNIVAKVVGIQPGPVVIRFELELAPGTKASKITTLSKDLARSLSVSRVLVVEVTPGKSTVGIDIPQAKREIVRLRELFGAEDYQNSSDKLILALGKDIAGRPVIVDLAKMPHLLVAGTTGSGKSVGINAMLLSLLYCATPDQVRLMLIDPKMIELSTYADIPHLLTPVVTDMQVAEQNLRWCITEMERRYALMSELGVRNITNLNTKYPEQALPYIVVIIDEFADLIMVIGKKIEELIARLAQKARAAGIHLILATQRPSVDVITGLIKANIPTRIAFQVSSRIDSRTILDQQGAEQLLGNGDMLYLAPGQGQPERVHGAFVSDDEVHRVVEELKKQGKPQYVTDLVTSAEQLIDSNDFAETDDLYDQAVEIVVATRKTSISYLQRRLKIGYNRSARLLEQMERVGIISEVQRNGLRQVLVSEQV